MKKGSFQRGNKLCTSPNNFFLSSSSVFIYNVTQLSILDPLKIKKISPFRKLPGRGEGLWLIDGISLCPSSVVQTLWSLCTHLLILFALES